MKQLETNNIMNMYISKLYIIWSKLFLQAFNITFITFHVQAWIFMTEYWKQLLNLTFQCDQNLSLFLGYLESQR